MTTAIRRPRLGTDPQRASDELAQSTEKAFDQLQLSYPGPGVLVKNIRPQFDSNQDPADIQVTHGLNRTPRGYFVAGMRCNSPFQVWTSSAANPSPQTHLLLSHNSALTALQSFDLWVF